MDVANFSAGPAALPRPVLEQAQDELLSYRGSGVSIMAQSHRGPDYDQVHHAAREGIGRLLELPDSHDVLFLQGGASAQFALVPMNFLPVGKRADYLLTGVWSDKALAEAGRCGGGEVRSAGTGATDAGYVRIPGGDGMDLDPGAAYLHLTSNNTIVGTQYHAFPEASVPLVADMSSDILSRPLDVRPFGLIYAGAQKNLGPAGVTVVIIDRDFMGRGRTDLPNIFRYQVHAEKQSLYHTPPTLAVYFVMRVVEWIEGEGGLEGMAQRNRSKQEKVYRAIDGSGGFYRSPVEPQARSWMNVVFRLPSEELEARFVGEAQERSMVGLKGHRSVGGIRASLYNAVEVEHVDRLVAFMGEFARRYG